MIFWILLTLAVVVAVGTYIYWGVEDSWGWAFIPSAIAAVISGLVGCGLLALALVIPGEKVTEETFGLRALSSSSTIQGRFFLGSGYVDGKRTLNYIAQEGDYSRLGSAFAAGSRVFEGAEAPTVTEYTFWYSNGWVVPWERVTGRAWDFRIPADSILEDYTITNE